MKWRCPVSNARAMDVPLACAPSRARRAVIPCPTNARSRRSPSASAPTFPRNVTRAPREAAAMALLAPPPPMLSTMRETEVSPSRNRYSPGGSGAGFRSRFMFPTTQSEPPVKMPSSNMRQRLPDLGQARDRSPPTRPPDGERGRHRRQPKALAQRRPFRQRVRQSSVKNVARRRLCPPPPPDTRAF